MVLEAEFAAQEAHNGFEALRASAFEARLAELRSVGKRGETDRHCTVLTSFVRWKYEVARFSSSGLYIRLDGGIMRTFGLRELAGCLKGLGGVFGKLVENYRGG